MNRLTQKSYPDSTTVAYTYDLANHLTQVVDPTGTYGFTFDADGRLTQTSTAYSFIAGKTFTVGYGYDAAANRTSMTDPQNAGTSYVYDTLNRLQTLTSPQGAFGFSYDSLSRRSQLTRPNSVTTTYSYDPLSRLLSVLHKLGAATLDGASYTVDNAGNRTSKTDQRTGLSTSYGYDNIYQLLTATQGGSTTENYTYDPVGNRLTSLAGNSSYNGSNELTASPTATFTYDNNGNTLSKTDSTGATQYAWDFENRLSSVILPASGGTVTFKYDPFGRRILKVSTSGTINYLYDGSNSLEEVDAAGNLVARYTQTQNIDEPLAMLRSGATSFYNADGLGSISSLSNSSGALAATYTFDSFGNQTASTGTLTNPFRHTARELDSETGLYFFRARYYDSQSGRFLNQDPIGFSGGVNFFKATANNPVNFSDPSGLCTDPGGSGTRYCVEAYIPSSTALAGPIPFSGDGRGPNSNGGTFRFHQDYGSNGAHTVAGISKLLYLFGVKAHLSKCSIQALPGARGKKRLRFRAAAGDGWGFGVAAPDARYDITVAETDTGTYVTGFATDFPSVEVWQYSDDHAPVLIFSHAAEWGSFMGPISLIPPDPMIPLGPVNTAPAK